MISVRGSALFSFIVSLHAGLGSYSLDLLILVDGVLRVREVIKDLLLAVSTLCDVKTMKNTGPNHSIYSEY